MTINILVILLFLGIGTFNSDARGSDEQARLDMAVSLQKDPHGKYLIRVRLTNSQTSTASITDFQLPWLAPNQFMLVPEGNRLDNTSSELRSGGPFADYNGTEYRIKAGESIEGDIVLEGLFPTIAEDIRQYGVSIEWACKSKSLRLTCKQGKGGRFMIPKGGL